MKIPSGKEIIVNLYKAVAAIVGVWVVFEIGGLLGGVFGSFVN